MSYASTNVRMKCCHYFPAVLLAILIAISPGAFADSHWSYRKPVRPAPPVVRDRSWPRNPIDAFVLARLENEGLTPSPQAERARLIRRVTLDLTGLPPSPREVDAFLADKLPDAYERLVDRLLASPRYGERWARHWLDLARYADSNGFQRDGFRDLWAYRDWVIRAFNADMPFDRFTIEQLAGDLLPDATIDQKIATGFHRCTTVNVEAGTDQEENRVNQVVDRVNTTATVWLGATIGCAQCHNHKYDPVSMREYYQLLAFFNNTEIETKFRTAKATAAVDFVGPMMEMPNIGANARTLVMKELPQPRRTTIMRRGNFLDPGDEVKPAVPAYLHPLRSGPANRLTLANWLVDRNNPLAARVTVNRIWAEFFGHGLAATLEDFGVMGERPTHPELLDWLAVKFMEGGWSMKSIHRLIVTSATYRQSSALTPVLRIKDDRNRLFARGPRLRMDAEMIRDNALSIAGLLSGKLGGPPVKPFQPEGVWRVTGLVDNTYRMSEGEDRHRRGVYVVWRRSAPYPSFVNFGAPIRATCVVQRSRSNTPLQALTLLNDPVYVEAAQALARRICSEVPADELDQRLRYAFRICLARPPSLTELSILRELYERARVRGEAIAWFEIAVVLLNLDETITKG